MDRACTAPRQDIKARPVPAAPEAAARRGRLCRREGRGAGAMRRSGLLNLVPRAQNRCVICAALVRAGAATTRRALWPREMSWQGNRGKRAAGADMACRLLGNPYLHTREDSSMNAAATQFDTAGWTIAQWQAAYLAGARPEALLAGHAAAPDAPADNAWILRVDGQRWRASWTNWRGCWRRRTGTCRACRCMACPTRSRTTSTSRAGRPPLPAPRSPTRPTRMPAWCGACAPPAPS